MSSIRSNIALNTVNTITSVLFPVITFPYAARVLMPDGIGTISFLNGIVSYIVLITSLGIPLYAVKKISEVRDNEVLRNRTVLEILTLNALLCIAGYIIVGLLARLVPEIHARSEIFYALSLSILFTTIGVEWFYQAIEDFKYITVRAVIVRTAAAACLFIFVRTPADLLNYAFITVGSTIGNNIINFWHLRKYKIFAPGNGFSISLTKISSHLKPALMVFSITAISSIYLSLNSVMLGFMATESEVGLFAAATKITQIAITVIFSAGTVLLPRFANLEATGNITEFKSLSEKALNLSLMLSLPIVAGLMILSSPIILIFCGADYRSSITLLVLNSPMIFFSTISFLTGIQILYPKGKIYIVVWSACAGAVVNLLINFLLIPHYGAKGAAVSIVIAELTVLTVQLIWGRKYLPFSVSRIFELRYYITTFVMVAALLPVVLFTNLSNIALLLIVPFAGMLIYFVCLLAAHDKLSSELFRRLCGRTHC